MSTETETENQDSSQQEERYLKLAATPNRGDKAVATIRLLDYPGVEVFRHWIGAGDLKYPYNCPGPRGGCPACRERSIAKIAGEDHRQIHRMDHRRVVNVLDLGDTDNPKLKVFSMGPAVEKRLKSVVEQDEEDGLSFADPTAYDIKIIKTKTGDQKFDVDYDVRYVRNSHKELSPIAKALASNKHDLKPETTSAPLEAISAAMGGQRPASSLASAEQKAQVEKVLEAQGLAFIDVKVTNPDSLTAAKAAEIIRDLG